jgi:hypothetical protein
MEEKRSVIPTSMPRMRLDFDLPDEELPKESTLYGENINPNA